MERRRRDDLWFAGVMLLASALAGIDALVMHHALVTLEVLPPVLAAARLRVRQTALVAAYSTGLALLVGWPDHFFGSVSHLIRVGIVAAVGLLGVWIALSRRAEWRARRRYSLIAEVGWILQSRLDFEVTLIEVAKLAARELADWCFVFLAEEDGSVHQVAAVHRDPERQQAAWELLVANPLAADGEQGPARVVRTGEPELVRDQPQEAIAWNEESIRLLRDLDVRSAMTVPLNAAGRTFGALVLATAESGKRYDRSDLELAIELTGRVAISVDNARLYSRLREAERDLRASRDELRAILDGVADAVTVQDQSGRVIFANQAGLEVLGVETPEALASGPYERVTGRYELLTEDGEPFPRDELPGRVALAGGEPEPKLIRLHDNVKGNDTYCIVKSTPVLDENGKPALAINVTEDVTEQREREDAARFLGEASAALSTSLEYEATLAKVAQLAVPRIADWCGVDIVTEDGTIENVAVAHVDAEKVRWARELNRRYPPDPDADTGVPQVLRTGHPELYAAITDEMIVQGARDEEHLRVIRELGMTSAMIVPMTARGRTLGAITFVTAESGKRFDETDLALARELAARCALAIDNARLYRERSYIARTLQESLLPPHLPELPGLDVAARFRAAGQGYEVGGDFYDLFEGSAGRWAVVIGDVCGKGAEAAAITALARYTLRAAAMRESNPVRILEMLNQAILRQRTDRRFCTVLYAYASHVNGGVDLDFSSGGHPLPIVLRANGKAEEIGHAGTLIGIAPDPELREDRLDLGPGDAVVLYTDGVTDAHAPAQVWTSEELAEQLAGLETLDADGIAERVVDLALGESMDEPRDDIAVLVIKVPEKG